MCKNGLNSKKATSARIVTILLWGVMCLVLMCLEGSSTSTVNIKDFLLKQTTQNLQTLEFPSSDKNIAEAVSVIESFGKAEGILYKSLYVDEDREVLIAETVYQSKDLEAVINSEGLFTLERFNEFLSETEFDASTLLYSPVELVKTKKGNCYAYTLLTMYFLDRFYPEVNYEIITEQYPTGGSHIYLKILGSKGDIVCDLTISPILELP